MAEFQEVVRQAKRMCASYRNDCAGCGLANDASECPFEALPEGWSVKFDRLAEIEHIVMDWAAKHPDPKYPSWHEAWKQLFPDGQGSPCPAAYGMENEPEYCASGNGCKKCKDRPMPAEIAEKLGIKPMGGVANENA